MPVAQTTSAAATTADSSGSGQTCPSRMRPDSADHESQRDLRCKGRHFANTTRPLVSVRVHNEDGVTYCSDHVRRVDVES